MVETEVEGDILAFCDGSRVARLPSRVVPLLPAVHKNLLLVNRQIALNR